MTKPVRLQLSRQKNFNLQVVSVATNGLPAVNCARPSRYGNPFRVDEDSIGWAVYDVNDQRVSRGVDKLDAILIACQLFRQACRQDPRIFEGLRGKNLACWCARAPCHVDVLLELANNPSS